MNTIKYKNHFRLPNIKREQLLLPLTVEVPLLPAPKKLLRKHSQELYNLLLRLP
jgi:hypothetical protein